jgi:ABC-type Fe3+ transport system permease subunit
LTNVSPHPYSDTRHSRHQRANEINDVSDRRGASAMAVVTRPDRRFGRLTAVPRRSWDRRVLGRDWRTAYLFVLPLVVVLVGLVAYPFINGIVLSMQHKVVGRPATWVGLDNYRELLTGAQYSEVFRKSVRTTVVYTVVSVALKLLLGLLMALMLN